jgi:hypothetical protein
MADSITPKRSCILRGRIGILSEELFWGWIYEGILRIVSAGF